MDFNAMDLPSKIFLVLAVFSTTIFIAKIVLSLAGIEHNVDADFDLSSSEVHYDTSGGGSEHFDCNTNLISINSILAFLTGFSLVGFTFSYLKIVSIVIIIPTALGMGLLLMFITAFTFFQMKKFEKINKYDIKDCIGKVGKSYTSLKAKGEGQVQIEAFGRLNTFNAINISEDEIPSFSDVLVVDTQEEKLVISLYKEEN